MEKLKANYALKVKFTHFPLHPDTPEEGKSRTIDPARSQQMKTLMENEGLPYNRERNMSYNSRLAQELAKWAESKGKGDEIHDAIFRAYFVDLKNIARREVLLDIVGKIGLPADEAAEVLESRSFKEAVDADWQRCAQLGVTAVPTFVVNRYALVGAHPYEALEELVLKASSPD
ncbi:MAG: DsbA family oxidoreductase [Deltaproteobacteria bacterium]|nr:DsbA family oxidoreductase [Deltaproteobacteria bacterium]